MKKTILLVAILLSACTMTNEEIIAATQQCKDAGMGIEIVRFMAFTGHISSIQCSPREDVLK